MPEQTAWEPGRPRSATTPGPGGEASRKSPTTSVYPRVNFSVCYGVQAGWKAGGTGWTVLPSSVAGRPGDCDDFPGILARAPRGRRRRFPHKNADFSANNPTERHRLRRGTGFFTALSSADSYAGGSRRYPAVMIEGGGWFVLYRTGEARRGRGYDGCAGGRCFDWPTGARRSRQDVL